MFVLLAGCLDGIDPRWQLDHDRVVAARATPPSIAAGETATLDALVAHKGAPTSQMAPVEAVAAGAASLMSTVVFDSGVWSVVAPSEDVLAQARAELSLPPGAPVPLPIGMTFPGSDSSTQLVVEKTITLGVSAENPTMPAISFAGGAPGEMLTVPGDVDVPMSVTVDPTWTVSWLTSCGTMHDDDEQAAFLHVLPDDPMQGELALVIRDAAGGVVWQVWPISAEPAE
ncbi:MAG TPA: hypothetical protein VGO00_26670 [Kofleriaceae bacterium]|nr:hypothetical protein [Kofleriaceae bacterium]